LSTKGHDLTRMKRLIDLNYITSSMHSLLYEDLSHDMKKDILQHIQKEADELNKITDILKRPCKILSDIDDTLFCSLYDVSYPKSVTYPGIINIYEAIVEGDLVFLSARPDGPMEAFRIYTAYKLMKFGVKVPFTMLTGSILKLFTNEAMAQKKYDNYLEYKVIYPEFRFFFFGDSGQGDIITGQMMQKLVQEKKTAGDDITVCIHDIHLGNDAPKSSPARRQELANSGVFLFDTYISTAMYCYQRNLLSKKSLNEIATLAPQQLEQIPFKSSSLKQSRKKEIDLAAKQVKDFLEADK